MELITPQQLADLLHVNEKTLGRWRAEELGPPYIRIGGRRIAYDRAAVDAWLARHSYPHRAAEAAERSAA